MVWEPLAGNHFSMDVPSEWEIQDDGKQTVLHGPDREELIVTANTIVITGGKDTHYSESDFQKVRQQLFQNAVHAVENAGNHPDLIITSPLSKDERICRSDCWTFRSVTRDAQTLFLQAVVFGDSGVLLVTFESPNVDGKETLFFEFLARIKSISRK